MIRRSRRRVLVIDANTRRAAVNFDLARRFAYEIVSRSIERNTRIALLIRVNRTGKLVGLLEACELAHLTSGFSIELRTAHDARRQAGTRSSRRTRAMNARSARETLAFEKVAKAFFVARVHGELMLSGTMSDAVAIHELPDSIPLGRSRSKNPIAGIRDRLTLRRSSKNSSMTAFENSRRVS